MSLFDHQPGLEFRPPDELQQRQELLLRTHLQYAGSHSPYYRRLFRELGIDSSAITLNTLSHIPCTDKNTFAAYNDSFCAVPPAEIVDIALSSGTTGAPVTVMYTENDLQRLAYNEQLSFAGCGITNTDRVLLTCTLDRCFIAGLAYFSGARSIGAAVIRNGQTSIAGHLESIRRLQPTVMVGVPSFLLKLGIQMRNCGADPAGSSVTRLVCIGEPIRNGAMQLLPTGAALQRLWGAQVYSTYASSETITSFCECCAQQGGHLHPELAVVEIVNDCGEPLPAGATGEVVVTPLAVTGMPLVRFKTGDISFLLDTPCSCGSNSVRLGPILGRKHQMLKYRGTTFYPESLYALLDNLPEITDYCICITAAADLSDEVTVYAATCSETCTPEAIMEQLQSRLRVRPEVIITDAEQVRAMIQEGASRKLTRFLDRRQQRGGARQ